MLSLLHVMTVLGGSIHTIINNVETQVQGWVCDVIRCFPSLTTGVS